MKFAPNSYPAVMVLVAVLLAGCSATGSSTSSAPAPAAPAATSVAATVPVARTTVSTPESLGGKVKADVDTGNPFAAYDKFGITAKMSAVYGDPKGNDFLVLAAAIAVSKGTAQERFDQFKTELAGDDFKAKSFSAIQPGVLGGLAECGNGVFDGEDSGVCVWSDDTTTGFLVKTRADGLALANTFEFEKFRAEIEKPI